MGVFREAKRNYWLIVSLGKRHSAQFLTAYVFFIVVITGNALTQNICGSAPGAITTRIGPLRGEADQLVEKLMVTIKFQSKRQ
jgi:hypothetical protein